MTNEHEMEMVTPPASQTATTHAFGRLTDDELSLVVGGDDGPGNPGDHNGAR